MMHDAWLASLRESVAGFLASLADAQQPGRYQPCLNGATPIGRRIGLGFSCFALKTFYALRLWDELPAQKREEWTKFIQRFQHANESRDRAYHGAFEDEPLVRFLTSELPLRRRVAEWLDRVRFGNRGEPDRQHALTYSETKQAIATLQQVGEQPLLTYRGFPSTPDELRVALRALNWQRPWGAGGQASAHAVLVVTQAPRFLPAPQVIELREQFRAFFESVAHAETGAYFQGPVPAHGQLINGAMKVLTALDWLKLPIHRPCELINTCLAAEPRPDGCHLVDAVYVLYRASKEVAHRRSEVGAYCRRVLELIRGHHQADGGFSYHATRTQTFYYGAPIARGLREGDIHGTCLLTWALAMIGDLLEEPAIAWRVIRP